MARATFTLNDEDGQVRLEANFEGGFDASSPAHVAGKVVIGMMEQLQSEEQAAGVKKINTSQIYGRSPSLVLLG